MVSLLVPPSLVPAGEQRDKYLAVLARLGIDPQSLELRQHYTAPNELPKHETRATAPDRRKAAVQQNVRPGLTNANQRAAWLDPARAQLHGALTDWYSSYVKRASAAAPRATVSIDALKSGLKQAYTPTASEKQAFSASIVEAHIAAYRATYLQHAAAVHATNVPQNFQPDATAENDLTDDAESNADDIIVTLTNAVLDEIDDLTIDEDEWRDEVDKVHDNIRDFVTQFSLWKALEITRAETSMGADSASGDFVDAIQSGLITLADEYEGRSVVVAVLPADSSNDICAQWAGTYTSIDNYDDVPDFPVHPNCIHVKHIAFEDEVS